MTHARIYSTVMIHENKKDITVKYSSSIVGFPTMIYKFVDYNCNFGTQIIIFQKILSSLLNNIS